MTAINFYQLATRRAEAVLPQLVTKALAAGHRIAVRTPDPALLARLDDALWQDGFLPHGIDTALGPDRAASQPVLLSTNAPWVTNAADCLAQIGADIPDDLSGLTRVLFLFDGDGITTARARWRHLAGIDGIRPVYWREADGGRFEKAG